MTDTDLTRQQIRRGWEQTSLYYGDESPQIFQRFAERLVQQMDWDGVQSVLDIGSGTGVVALRALERIAPSGLIVASDFAWGMLSRIHRPDAPTAVTLALAQMDAEHLSFAPESFDRVTCAFSLFQFMDMIRALSEMHRVLKPGGQVGLSNWASGFFAPVASMQRNLFRQFGLRPLLPNPIAFAPEQIEAMLEQVGFTEIRSLVEPVELYFSSPQEVWEWNLAMGPFPIMLEQQLTPMQQQELHHLYLEMVQPLMTPKGIPCTFYPLYTLARKPGLP